MCIPRAKDAAHFIDVLLLDFPLQNAKFDLCVCVCVCVCMDGGDVW